MLLHAGGFREFSAFWYFSAFRYFGGERIICVARTRIRVGMSR